MKRPAAIVILCLAPLVALANPYVLNPGSLIAFGVIVFSAMVVESGVVALLLACKGMRVLPVFFSYFLCNAAVFLFVFYPLAQLNWPVLGLELLVIGVDALAIRFIALIPGLQGDNYCGMKWWQALALSAIGNGSSFFLGAIAQHKPWES
jgi:hypothetical protein